MTPEPTDRDEDALRALFDATAEDADGALLTRLQARAADIPGARTRRRFRALSWGWAPGVGGLAVAAGAALFAWGPGWLGQSGTEGALHTADVGVTTLAPAAAELRSKPAIPSSTPRPQVATSVASGLELEAVDWSEDESELEAWQGPIEDEELDAWLYATAELVNDVR